LHHEYPLTPPTSNRFTNDPTTILAMLRGIVLNTWPPFCGTIRNFASQFLIYANDPFVPGNPL